MKVTAILEKPEGQFEFSAELSPVQHQFLIEYAIKDLISKGLIPFHDDGIDAIVSVLPDASNPQ